MNEALVCKQIADEIMRINPSVKIVVGCLDGKHTMFATKNANMLNLPQGCYYENGSIINKHSSDNDETYCFPFYYLICAR